MLRTIDKTPMPLLRIVDILRSSEPTECLKRPTAHLLSDFFGGDVSAIKVVRTDKGRACCRALGVPSLTFGSCIVVDDDVCDVFSQEHFPILVHEAAHWLQTKPEAYRFGAPMAALEEEADEAVAAYLHGQPFTVCKGGNSQTVLTWGYTGHFLTTYLVYLNFKDSNAFQNAVYCWLPDQVKEFDAYTLYSNMYGVGGTTSLGINPLDKWIKINAGQMSKEAKKMSEREYFTAVHKGLHCLTGGTSENETTFRQSILSKKNHLSPLLRGLAHHPLGDSFAHRTISNDKVLYDAGFGHGGDLTAPDEPWTYGRGWTYRQYIQALFDVAAENSGNQPTLDLEDFVYALKPIFHRNEVNESSVLEQAGQIKMGKRQNVTGVINYEKIKNKINWIENAAPITDDRKALEHFQRVATERLGNSMVYNYDPDRPAVYWYQYLQYFCGHEKLTDLSQGRYDPITRTSIFNSLFNEALKWANAGRSNGHRPQSMNKPALKSHR